MDRLSTSRLAERQHNLTGQCYPSGEEETGMAGHHEADGTTQPDAEVKAIGQDQGQVFYALKHPQHLRKYLSEVSFAQCRSMKSTDMIEIDSIMSSKIHQSKCHITGPKCFRT